MNIYFAGSIRGGRQDAENYAKIIKELSSFGIVLTEHVGDAELLKEELELSDVEIHDRDIEWLNASSVVCAEVTQPSLGVGYEIALAMKANIPTLCMFNTSKNTKLSAMITGNKYYTIIYYSTLNELFLKLSKCFEDLGLSKHV